MKDQIKRELVELLPDDTSLDLVTRLATYIGDKKKEIFEQVKQILVDEINLAHSTTSGKTSRLTSAYNRISELE